MARKRGGGNAIVGFFRWLATPTNKSTKPASTARGTGKYSHWSKEAKAKQKELVAENRRLRQEMKRREAEDRRQQKAETRQAKKEQAPAANDSGIADRLARGEIKGDALKQLFASGSVRVGKKNPTSKVRKKGKRKTAKNPVSTADARALALATEQSKRFHGRVELVELSPKERCALSRYAVVLGEVPSLMYEPDPLSQRGKLAYIHEAGDRGTFKAKARHKPLLVADPVTRRVTLVNGKSPMKFDPDAGIVG